MKKIKIKINQGKNRYKAVEKFEYKTPQIENQIGHYVIDVFFLLFWILITTLLINLHTKKNNYEQIL